MRHYKTTFEFDFFKHRKLQRCIFTSPIYPERHIRKQKSLITHTHVTLPFIAYPCSKINFFHNISHKKKLNKKLTRFNEASISTNVDAVMSFRIQRFEIFLFIEFSDFSAISNPIHLIIMRICFT